MAKNEAPQTTDTAQADEKDKTINLSVTLTPEIAAQVDEARWTLRQPSRSAVIRAILEAHFAAK